MFKWLKKFVKKTTPLKQEVSQDSVVPQHYKCSGINAYKFQRAREERMKRACKKDFT